MTNDYLQLLEAAITAEEALLDAKGIASVKLGLRTLEFNRHYLLVTLGRASSDMRAETMQSAKEMLYLLRDLVSDSEEVYNGIVWQLVCCPFTPFLALFGEILANKGPTQDTDRQALEAMKELPTFLKKTGLRNTLAAKLERIAVVIVQHAESVVHTPQCTYECFLWLFTDQHQTDHKNRHTRRLSVGFEYCYSIFARLLACVGD